MTQLSEYLTGKAGYLAAMNDSNPDDWECYVIGTDWEDFCLWKHRRHEVLNRDTTRWRKRFVEVAKAEIAADRIAELESMVEELKQLWKDEMSRASRARYALEIASGFFGNSSVDSIRQMIHKMLKETEPTDNRWNL